VDDAPEVWIPTELRKRDQNLKQGSRPEAVDDNEAAQELYKKATDMALVTYNALLETGVAPEVARGVLPQAMYTEFIETGSLAAYARLCGLRLDPHAQKEIQDFAAAVSSLVAERFPVSWSALVPSEPQPPPKITRVTIPSQD
jgi:thymidylate synthase (FAD)